VVYSTLSARSIEDHVLTHYTLQAPLRCEFFHRDLNDTYRIWAGDRCFALRVYRTAWRSPTQVHAELSALAHLANRGVCVARSRPRADGEWIGALRAPEGMRPTVLFDWADGEQPQYSNPADAAHYGRLAAKLHNASSDFDATLMEGRPLIDADYLLEQPLARMRSVLKAHPEAESYFDGLRERLRVRLARVEFSGLDWGLCHGDLHCGNAVVAGDQLTVFDFDCCGVGFRAFDLATFRWAARLRGQEDHAWQPFIEAYREHRPLTETELAAIPTFMILRAVWLLGAIHAPTTAHEGTSFYTRKYFQQAMAFCGGLESELLAL
jgi:Ser/Thr protein kinase RdoA (MazF antagonist)